MASKLETLINVWIEDGKTAPQSGGASVRIRFKDDQVLTTEGTIRHAMVDGRRLEGLYSFDAAIPMPHPQQPGAMIGVPATMYFSADDIRWISPVGDDDPMVAAPNSSGSGLVVPSA